MHRPFQPIAWLLAGLLTAASGQAEIYRWIDDEGKLQFGDRPPDARGADKVELEPGNRYSHREIEPLKSSSANRHGATFGTTGCRSENTTSRPATRAVGTIAG